MLTFLIFLTASLYAAIGQGGGSGYLALMGIFNIDPASMRPTALALNIIVTAITTYKFTRAGFFSWKLFLPFALTSIPFAFWGGYIQLESDLYHILVGGILVFAAGRLFIASQHLGEKEATPPPLGVALISGAIIGFLSGISGVGGAIFLSPLLLLMGWATPKQTAGVAAVFVLVNSAAALLGTWTNTLHLPSQFPAWALAVLLGAWLGAEIGSRKLGEGIICKVLSAVLLLGGSKMIFFALG